MDAKTRVSILSAIYGAVFDWFDEGGGREDLMLVFRLLLRQLEDPTSTIDKKGVKECKLN